MRWWIPILTLGLLGAAPVRDNTYIARTTIQPGAVMDNEDPLYSYLQAGVEIIAPSAVTTTALADNAVTSAKIADGTITTADLAFSITAGNILPAGAIFFLITGSCPSWTTDVSTTYSNQFVRINATQGTTGGASTHTHTAGSFASPAHQHPIPNSIGDNSGGATDTGGGQQYSLDDHTHGGNTGSSGGVAISGTSDSGSSLPSFVTMKACKVI